MKKRALISVSDKRGIEQVARRLAAMGYEIVSTGGTYKAICDAGIPAVNISSITNFPECLDGRVKTLHPAVHAGLLAVRDNEEHMEQLKKLNIGTIDVVIVNLYPFRATVMKEGVTFEEAVENIDIGGPTMLRSAAKNAVSVVVIVDPEDYDVVLDEMESGEVSRETRLRLMYKVYQHTAVYDSMISEYLRKQVGIEFPEQITMSYEKMEDLRYGENPHQSAALYKESMARGGSLVYAKQLNGKQLSYNNLNDANGAIMLLKEFDRPTAVAVKHSNPCGVASADTICEAYVKAHDADPVSIYGGIIALNRKVDKKTAEELHKTFLEIVIAPGYEEEALEVLCTKKNLRVLELPEVGEKVGGRDFKKIDGGLLLQTADSHLADKYENVTTHKASEEQLRDMRFGMKVVKHCKSNAVIVVKDEVTLGLGIGQTNRIWATNQAIEHSLTGVKGAVLVSDAYFPFNDSVLKAAESGIAAIVQPGGSIRDEDSIKAAEEKGLAMVFTGVRHFKH